MPVSITANSSIGIRPRSLMILATKRTEPTSVNFTALPTRLRRICLRRVGSLTIFSGMAPSISAETRIPASSARTLIRETTSRMI